MTILTAVPPNPTGYGRVLRANESSPEVTAIVEQKSLTPDQLSAPEINSGIYCFQTAALFAHLDSLSTNNAHGEFYLTDVAALLVADRQRVVALKSADSVDEVLGANTIDEMMHLDAAMRLATARRLMAQGVTIFRPETCVIDAEVEVGPDTIIEPYVQILGQHDKSATTVDLLLYRGSEHTLGDNVLLRNGCILAAVDHRQWCHTRPLRPSPPRKRNRRRCPHRQLRRDQKNENGPWLQGQSPYLSWRRTIGSGVNIGAGTITCNYDGIHKHHTKIGNNAFIGSNSTLVAPITIGDEAYIAAASCITEDVPADALALGRSRQTTKPGWVSKRKRSQLQKCE